MIFQHTWQKVINGRKTQTRRLMQSDRCQWRVGSTYAVQPGRGKKAVARIRLLSIRQEDVRSISQRDAQAEGFSSPAEFLTLWERMHGQNYNAWALTFERCTE